MALLAIAGAMAAKDAIGTALVIVEARGRAWLAGILDAGLDIAALLFTFLGVKALDDWGHGGPATLAVVCLTSLVVTTATTRVVHRWTTESQEEPCSSCRLATTTEGAVRPSA